MNLLTRALVPVLKGLDREVGIRGAEPRKGNFSWMSSMPSKKVLKPIVINALTLKQLSNTDPITWAIKATRKSQITQTKWDIVRDTEAIEAELDRWHTTIVNNLNPWGFEEVFHPLKISKEMYLKAVNDIKNILATPNVDRESRKKQLKWYFESLKRKVKQDADEHANVVRRIFEKPNDSETKNFRTFIELLVDDILTFDAGVIVKNKNYMGELAELYLLPGQDVKIYRNPDRTVPNPPEYAYCWEENGVLRAEYTKEEVVYMMNNPQQNGYGMSPLEVAAYVITASLYADEYNIDFFRHSNVPPAIFNLGKNVTQEQKRSFELSWDNEVQGKGLHRMMFLAGAENPQYVPIRNLSSRDMQMMEYLKWTLSVKCACFQISPQDISFVQDFHRSTAQVQKELTKERGIKTLLSLIETYFNTEIVKKEFPFKDVKFQWLNVDLQDEVQQAAIDINDINAGVISRNDRRIRLGMPPIDGGDVVLVNLGANGYVPIEDLVPPEQDQAADQPIEQALQEKEQSGQPTQLGEERKQAQGEAIDSVPGQGQPNPKNAVPGGPQGQKTGTSKPPTQTHDNLMPEEKMKMVKMIVQAAQQDKIGKAMESLKAQGLGENEVRITLEE